MRNHRSMKRIWMFGLVLAMLIPVLAACTKQAPATDNTVRTLRFATSDGYIGDNGSAFREYTELFEFEHKNIQLEFLETINQSRYRFGLLPDEVEVDPFTALKEAMTGPTPPDIVILNYDDLQELINENLLISLDEMFMQEKDFNMDNIVPAVMEGLRKPGNGTLYAVSPTFYSSAVIYNKQLFLNRGVEFPTDNMTWQEVFDLARRVTVQDEQNPVYGFSFTSYDSGLWGLYHNMGMYVQPLGLSWIDPETLQMTANTPAWQEVWTTLTDLYKEKIVPQDLAISRENPGPFDWDLFLSGRAAMAIVPYSYLHEVVAANNQAERIDNFEAVDWDVVTVPTHPEARETGASVYYSAIFAINANAENLEDAWRFIKYIMGEDYARIKSKSTYYLVARQDYIKPIQGVEYNHDAFLKLSPPDYTDYETILYEKLPDYWSIRYLGQQKFSDVIYNGKDVQLALQEWETEGQMMIQRQLEERENGGDGEVGIFGTLTDEKLKLLEASGEMINIETTDEVAVDETE